MTATPGRRRISGAKIGVAVITVLLIIYIAAIFRQAWLLVASADPIGVTMGVVLIVFPVVGAALIARELLFGMQTEQLLDRLAGEGRLPEDDLPKRPSGRPVRSAADADFPQWAAGVRDAPEDAGAWARLGLAYDASGDRRRARRALRTAVRLDRRNRSGTGRLTE